ncbi:M48 family metalloprotease [Parabacteroides massiliensis]|uniref:M48 family metalloprotease n=1 Tax=Parabacteroides massiliensis TaxID=1750560 RepID=UPI00096A641F|nr:M48 family metalloprotease [Parabacteroides massiliensis]
MKTTLRIFRILCKLLLLAYVTIVNFVFITVFYALLLSILRHIWPAYIPGVFDKGVIPHLVMTLPYYLLLLFILYSISPVNVWMLRRKEGYRPLNNSDRMRLERLLSEMGMNRKLKLYRNNDTRINATAFGFNTIGLTGGILAFASDEELKGVICHEVGHISHYDFVYRVLLFSMESFGYRCLYGIFLLPALIFSIIGSMVFALVPALSFVGELIAKLWWIVYKLLHRIIYGISRIADVNINKYTEYRCDTYAVEYGCGEGLLSFLRRLKRMEEVYGERPTFTEYIMSTHPSTEKRIARLEKQL